MSTTATRGGAERTGIGARLREARERRNLSLQIVAERTKIPAVNLEAIESDQLSRLPGGIFARSFVRAYAREVGLDPEESVRDFVRMHPEHAPPDTQNAQEGAPGEAAGSRALGRVVVVILAVAVLGAAGFAAYRWVQARGPALWGDEPAPGMPTAAGAPVETDPPVPAPGSTESGVPTIESADDAPTAAARTLDPGVAPPPASPIPSSATGVAAQAPPGPAPVTTAPTQAVDRIRLEIHPSAPCWVYVSADGRVLINRVVQPGERPVVVASAGLQLQVGDAGAFDYTINGQRGRSLGPAGRVVRVAIASDTVAEFMAR